jgi:hypothetical protein
MLDPEVETDNAGADDWPHIFDGVFGDIDESIGVPGRSACETVSQALPVHCQRTFQHDRIAGIVQESHEVEVVDMDEDRLNVSLIERNGHGCHPNGLTSGRASFHD